MQQWKWLHPHWEHRLWTEKEILAVLPDQWRGYYDQAKTLAGKADIARYWIIHQFGGVYLDTDRSCLKPIDELLVGCDAFLARSTPTGTVTNNIFGAVPGHPFFKAVLDNFPASFDPGRPNKSGPHLFTELARQVGSIRIFEQKVFSPVSYDDRHSLKQTQDFPGSYSVHYYEATWHGTGIG
jgi:mannosyltransferase OCH1-like enzyme